MANGELIEGIITNAHNYLIEALQRITKINSEISRAKLEIARLDNSSASQPKEDQGGSILTNSDEDGDECSSDLPTSPLISSRRKQSMRHSRLLRDDVATVSEASASSHNTSDRNSDQYSPDSRRKTSSQEY